MKEVTGWLILATFVALVLLIWGSQWLRLQANRQMLHDCIQLCKDFNNTKDCANICVDSFNQGLRKLRGEING